MENTNRKLTPSLALKKAFAVLMAVVMVLSAWVFTAPTFKAKAAAESYELSVNYYLDKSNDSSWYNNYASNVTVTTTDTGYTLTTDGQKIVGFTVIYREDNGTGKYGYKNFDMKSLISQTQSKSYTATLTDIPGFPVEVVFITDGNLTGISFYVESLEINGDVVQTYGSTTKGQRINGYRSEYRLKRGAKTETIWHYSGIVGYPSDGIPPASYTWTYPYAKEFSWTNNGEAATVTSGNYSGNVGYFNAPTTTDGVTTLPKIGVTATDQYGVQMFDPTFRISASGTNWTEARAAAVKENANGATTEVTIGYGANHPNSGNQSSAVYIYADWETPNSSTTKASKYYYFYVYDAVLTATFTGIKDKNGNDLADYVVSGTNTSTGQYYGTPQDTAAKTAEGYLPKLDDGTYGYNAAGMTFKFAGWSPETSTGITTDTTYTALYTAEFDPADYTEVDKQIQRAKDEGLYPTPSADNQKKYTKKSLELVKQAIESVVRDLSVGYQDSVVDKYAERIKAAIDGLELNTFDVVFIDHDDTILKTEKVEYGESATPPENPTRLPDETHHYTFDKWDDDSYKSVTDDLIISAEYKEERHDSYWSYTKEEEANCAHGKLRERVCDFCKYEQILEEEGEPIPDAHPADALYWAVTQDRTCTKQGEKAEFCSLCGQPTGQAETLEPLSHDYKIVSEENSTCTTPGEIVYECSRECGELNWKYTVDLPLAAHDYEQNGSAVAPTCTTSGYTPMKCENCESSYNEYDSAKPATGHSYGNWSIDASGHVTGECTVETCKQKIEFDVTLPQDHVHDFENGEVEVEDATCKNKGSVMITCADANCNETVTAEIPVNSDAHTNLKTNYDAAGCNHPGSVEVVCEDCGETLGSQALPELKHELLEYKRDAAKCEEAGTIYKRCPNCGQETTETINPTGHQTVKVLADCTHGAYLACVFCEYTEEINDEPRAHDFSGDVTTVPATCTQNGAKLTKCVNCDAYQYEVIEGGNGHDYEVKQTVLATCTSKGYTVKKCKNCDSEIITDFTEGTAPHTYNDEPDVTQESTCGFAGYKIYNCTECGQPKIETLKALEHDWSDDVHDATCTANGYTISTCANCGAQTYTEGDKATDHSYPDDEEHKLVVPASCTAAGYTVETCENCGNQVYTEGEAALGHDYTEFVKTVNANCSSDGYDVYKCERCDAVEHRANGQTALGHTYSEKLEDTIAATCTSNRYDIYKCERCDAVEYREVEDTALGHNYTKHIDTVAATCTSNSYEVYQCERCDAVEYRENEDTALDHDYTEFVKTVAATCTSNSYNVYKCERCDAVEHRENANTALGHNYTKFIKSVDATCTSDGYDVYECERCDAVEHRANDDTAKGHTYSVFVKSVPATCTENGYDVYECVRGCGAQEIRNETEAKGHTWSDEVKTIEPTCTQPRITYKECEECGTQEQEIEAGTALGHEYEDKYTIDLKPTCTETGVMSRHCVRYDDCGSKMDVKTVDKIDHAMSDWVTMKESTCSEEGLQVRNCLYGCGVKEERKLSKLAHTWGELLIQDWPATCTEVGQLSIHCLECSEIKPGSIVKTPMTPHTYKDEDLKTVIKPSCTTTGIQQVECEECRQTITLEMAALGHDFDMSVVLDKRVSADKTYKWDVFGCTRCGEANCVVPTIIARDEHGNPIEGATVILRDMHGSVISSGKTDASGEFRSTVALSDCDFAVYVRDDATYSEGSGKLTVKGADITGSFGSPDGSGNLGKGYCNNCSCHSGFFGKIKRWFYTFFSVIFNRTIKCCDDMEWQGSWASRLN